MNTQQHGGDGSMQRDVAVVGNFFGPKTGLAQLVSTHSLLAFVKRKTPRHCLGFARN